MKLNMFLAPAVAAFILIGCGDSVPKSEPSSSVSIVSEPETTEDLVAEPQYTFDGTQVVDLKGVADAENFRIRMVLQTAEDYIYNSEFSDTSPPMPFKSTPLSAYLINGNYSVRVATTDGSKADFLLGNVLDSNEIVFEKSCGTATLSFNGDPVFTGDVDQPVGTLFLGKGFNDRYWSGSFETVETEILSPICPN